MPAIKYTISDKDFAEYREKYIARQAVKRALKSGDLHKPMTCEICDKEANVEAHHIDYSKPLAIFWLCDACHGLAHRKGNPLNPCENEKTPTQVQWRRKDKAHVAISIPCENFIYIKKLAEKNNTTVSALIRSVLVEKFPVSNEQINFLSEDYDKQADAPKTVQHMVEDEDGLLKSKVTHLHQIWREGNPYLPGMEGLFQQIC